MSAHKYVAQVETLEAAIDLFGTLRAEGNGIGCWPKSMDDARIALHRAYDDLIARAPKVSAVEFLRNAGRKNLRCASELRGQRDTLLAALRYCVEGDEHGALMSACC